MMYQDLRNDFPILQQTVNGFPLVYLDNAATTQKPLAVIQAELDFYTTLNANIHRSIHTLGERATAAYEHARSVVAHALNAQPCEIIFMRGTTEGINLIALLWALEAIKPGDEIVLSQLEHHANLVPWQHVALKKGAVLKFIPIDHQGRLNIDELDSLVNSKTVLLAITHVSNVLGTQVDLDPIVARARQVGAKVLIDAAQSVPHQKIDVKRIDADFLVFSGHKMCGPTGIGVLYIKKEMQAQLEPFYRGGTMVHTVDWYDATWAKAPYKFEAGTPPIAQAIGLAAAFDYLDEHVNFEALKVHEARLCRLAIERLQKLPHVVLYGPLEQLVQSGHMVTFNVNGIHAHDVAAFLDSQGIAVRAGNHCAQPLSMLLGAQALVRASFYFYTKVDDVERLCDAIELLCKSLKS